MILTSFAASFIAAGATDGAMKITTIAIALVAAGFSFELHRRRGDA